MAKHNNDAATTTRQELASLDVRRKALEQEAAAITEELTSPTGEDGQGPPMGVDTPLVDLDGYPRSDIDLYRARTLRKRLSEIQTDHKQLMTQIAGLLEQLATLSGETKQSDPEPQHKPKPKYDPVSGKWVVRNADGTIAGAGKEHNHRQFDSLDSTTTPPVAQLAQTHLGASTAEPPTATDDTPMSDTAIPTTPFARVDAVSPHSPAATAGLHEGDLVLKFGSNISHQTADPFHAVAQLVPQTAGQQEAITIVVQRELATDTQAKEHITLQLTPRPWDGRGLLGCHIVPIKK